MAKYKAYPEYKDSGMEWCTALPVGWKRTNLRWLSSIYAGGTPSKNVIDYWENGTVPWINSGAVNQSYITEPSTFISKAAFENSSAKWIPKGALVVALAGQGKTKGMVAQLGINTTCNQSMAAIVFPKKSLSRYIYWWLTSNYQNIRNMAGGDLRDGLNLELLGDIQCPQPNDGECIRISAFLDHETAKIDNLIEKQRQLIELIKEKRQAVISHAVTKGLNSDVPMKDSGVEWLGEVPEHWKVSSLGYYSSLNTGATPDRSNSKYWNGEIAWIKTGEVNYNNIFSSEEKITCEAVKNTSVRLSPPGTLLMAMYGQGITRGRVAILNISATYNQACVAISPNETLLNVYLRLFFIAGYHAIRDGGNETSQMNLNADIVRKFKILVPPLSEQKEIVSYLDCHLPQIEMLVERADSVIALLQERRTALISAAVTGKIDVRDWVAPALNDAEVPQEATA